MFVVKLLVVLWVLVRLCCIYIVVFGDVGCLIFSLRFIIYCWRIVVLRCGLVFKELRLLIVMGIEVVVVWFG